MNAYAASVSPCIGACGIDETTGFCQGCARTRDEITKWRQEDGAYRQKIWDTLPQRFEELGISCRRLPWNRNEIENFVHTSLKEKKRHMDVRRSGRCRRIYADSPP